MTAENDFNGHCESATKLYDKKYSKDESGEIGAAENKHFNVFDYENENAHDVDFYATAVKRSVFRLLNLFS